MTWAARRPPTVPEFLEWWNGAISDQNQERHDDDPRCGWYRMQRVKGGVWVPVIIWADFDTDGAGELAWPVQIRAQTASGEELDPSEIWLWVTPISLEEYKRISQWREDYSHRLQDRSAVDLSTTPTRP